MLGAHGGQVPSLSPSQPHGCTLAWRMGRTRGALGGRAPSTSHPPLHPGYPLRALLLGLGVPAPHPRSLGCYGGCWQPRGHPQTQTCITPQDALGMGALGMDATPAAAPHKPPPAQGAEGTRDPTSSLYSSGSQGKANRDPPKALPAAPRTPSPPAPASWPGQHPAAPARLRRLSRVRRHRGGAEPGLGQSPRPVPPAP